MKRRPLLLSLPLLAVAALFALAPVTVAPSLRAAPIPEAARTPAGFTISVQAWSFNRFTVFEAIEKTETTGARGIEFYPGQLVSKDMPGVKWDQSASDELIGKVLEKCKKHNVVPVNFGVTSISKDEAKARQLFEFAKKLGLYGITTESVDAIDTIEKLVKEYDIRVGFHNHPKPSALWNPETVLKVIEGRDPRIGFCADIGHWPSSGMDPLEIVKRIAPRIQSFHFKDRESMKNATHDRVYGTGVVNLPAILDEARKHGFAGNVSIEYEYNWDNSIPDISQCVGFLRAYAIMRK